MNKEEQIAEIKRMIQDKFDGSTSTYELEADSSPCISSAGTNKMNVSTLVERFNYDDVEIVTYNNETEIASDNLSYEELSEDIIDEIYNLLNNAEVDEDEIDLTNGVETKFGQIKMNHAMIDVDGTNLEDGIEIRLDGKLIGEALGFTSSKLDEFESIEEVEKFVEEYCEI